MLRRALLLLSLLSTPVASAQAPPPAPISCTPVFTVLRQSPIVNVWWSTHRTDTNQTFAGISQMQLVLTGPDLVGTGTRHRVYWDAATPMSAPSLTEQVSLRMRADGTIVVKDGGQAFTPRCWSERFFTVHTGDSIEVFNIRLR